MRRISNRVYRSSEFVESVERYATTGKTSSDILNSRSHTTQATVLTSRLINHWESKGLLENTRDDAECWRRFSMIDLIWIHTLVELRSFGCSLALLKCLRDSLESQFAVDESDGRKVTYWEFFIAQAIVKCEQVYLLVFEDGVAEPVDQCTYWLLLRQGRMCTSHLAICLNRILQMLLPDSNFIPIEDSAAHFSPAELDILLILKTGEFVDLKLKRGNGKWDRIGTKHSIHGKAVRALLANENYLDVLIKRRNDIEHTTTRSTISRFPL